MRPKPHFLLAGLALLASMSSAHAALTFTLTPSVQLGAVSNEVVFTGTLSNTSPTVELFLNDVQLSFTGSASTYLTADTNAFFANVPGILMPGESYSDVVFGVAINAATPPGDYFGSFAILGGSNIVTATSQATQSFQVSVFASLFDSWRFAEFGANTNNPAISGALADPDHDGIANLLEYALHLDPNVDSVTGLPKGRIDPSCGCLTLTYTKAIGATDLIYSPESASDPGGPWTTNGVTQAIVDANNLIQTIRASDTNFPFASNSKRFMHLKVTRLP